MLPFNPYLTSAYGRLLLTMTALLTLLSRPCARIPDLLRRNYFYESLLLYFLIIYQSYRLEPCLPHEAVHMAANPITNRIPNRVQVGPTYTP